MDTRERALRVGGRRIRVSNTDRVLYPSTATTKGDVIAYYRAIAKTMLPHCRDRPATRKRWPDGVGPDGRGDSFFQKNLGGSAPDWVRTADIQHRDHVNTYPLLNDEATLVWLAQLASLEIHVPHSKGRRSRSGLPPLSGRYSTMLRQDQRPVGTRALELRRRGGGPPCSQSTCVHEPSTSGSRAGSCRIATRSEL